MGEIVVLGFHAIDLWHAMVVLNDNANHTRGIGLYNQWNKIEQQSNSANEIGFVMDIERRLSFYLRFGAVDPCLGCGKIIFCGTDGIKIFLQPFAISCWCGL